MHQLKSDELALASGSPEYAERDAWICGVWLSDTRIYPLYIVKEWDGSTVRMRLRLLDGHHRLAGAFHYRAQRVFARVGIPYMQPVVA